MLKPLKFSAIIIVLLSTMQAWAIEPAPQKNLSIAAKPKPIVQTQRFDKGHVANRPTFAKPNAAIIGKTLNQQHTKAMDLAKRKMAAHADMDTRLRNVETVFKSLPNQQPVLGRTLISSRCSGNLCSHRYQQTFQDQPIWGKELVALTDGKQVKTIKASKRSKITIGNTPTLSLAEAQARISAWSGCRNCQRHPITSMGLGISELASAYHYTYKFSVINALDDAWDVYVDAQSGEVIDKVTRIYDQTQTAAAGDDLNGVRQNFFATPNGDDYLLKDSSFPVGSTTQVWSFANTEESDNIVPITSTDQYNWDPAAVSALTNARKAYNFYLNTLARNGVDGLGNASEHYVHYGENYNNAFYADIGPGVMVYGDGDGEISKNLAGSLDVAGHEMTHGVIARTANLEYRFQSGALNEAFADYFGAMIEGKNWLIGEDIWIASPGYLRNMQDPTQGFSTQPKHMDDYVNLREDQDHGGVHINSGIINRALYLLTEGLSEEGLGTSLGRATAIDLVYKTLIALNSRSNFQDAAFTMFTLATSTWGAEHANVSSVLAAWQQVGIDASLEPEEVEIIYGNSTDTNVIAYLYNDDEVWVQFVDNSNLTFVEERDYLVTAKDDDGNSLLATNRPAVSVLGDDYYFVFYPSQDGAIQLVFLDAISGEAEAFAPLTLEGYTFSSVATDVSGRYLALTVEGYAEIYVYDFDKGDGNWYLIEGPNYSDNQNQISFVRAVDSLRFDPSSRKIAFDYSSCRDYQNGACVSTEFWSIGVLSFTANQILYPFSTQRETLDIGFPSFSSTSDQYIVLDIVDYEDTENAGYVAIFDTVSQTLTTLYSPDNECTDTQTWGVPSFSSDDQYVIGAYCTPESQLPSTIAMPVGEGDGVYISAENSSYSFAVPNNPVPISSALAVSPNPIELGDVDNINDYQGEICISNPQPVVIAYQGVSNDSTMQLSIPTQSLNPGEQICGNFTINLNLDQQGDFELSLPILSDGDTTNATFSGNMTGKPVPMVPTITRFIKAADQVGITISSNDVNDESTYITLNCGTQTATAYYNQVTINNLEPETSYQCQAYLSNDIGTGKSVSFTLTTEALSGSPVWLYYIVHERNINQ